MKSWNNRVGAVLAAIALTVAAFGQATTTPPATCTTPPTGLITYDLERTIGHGLMPQTNGGLTTLTSLLQLPAATLGAWYGGMTELRVRLVYNAQLGIVRETLFFVPVGTPAPTPNFDFHTGVVQVADLKIDQMYFGCNPVPDLLLVGRLYVSTPSLLFPGNGVFGPINGEPALLALGYTLDNPPKIHDFVEVVAGVLMAWSDEATGTLVFQNAPTGGGTTNPGTGPTVVLNTGQGSCASVSGSTCSTSVTANSTIQAPFSPFLLDATKSTGNGNLTFAWSTTGAPVAFVTTATPGQVLVQFPGPGDYGITLTVTDSTGAKATFSFNLQYTGRPQ